MKATALEVAKWMLGELNLEQILYQETAVWEIQEKFGGSFVYENDRGNLAISGEVLSEFKNISEDIVVWINGERYWRFREETDEPGRRQDY
ncbi:MAG: hypothetical protein NTX75_03220 [Proteobacteria bacterium]|nr:hypothetical protein [Pseudomonadota bacterium]